MTKKQIFGGILGIVLGVALALCSPPQGLTPQAMSALGILVWAVTYWIFEVGPEYVVAIGMCTLWAVFKCVPFKIAFATFADSTWWLLLGALGMGVAVSKSGLLKRLSLLVMKIFPASFNGQVLALFSAGFLISPLIPSVTAKAAIVAPVSMGISDAMGYERKSRGAGGLFGAMFVGFVLTGPMFLSASFVCYMMRGLLPAAVQEQFHWTYWFLAAFAYTVTVIVLLYFVIIFLYKPKEKVSLSKSYVTEQLAKIGPMSRNEKITAVVLVVALLFWMTETVHGISSTVIALLALVILLGSKVYDRPDFRASMAWDIMIFIGGIVAIGGVLTSLKIDKWLAEIFGHIITPMISNIYIFIIVLSISIYAARYLIVSFTAATAIFTVLLLPFAAQANVNPWVIGFIVFTSSMIWNVFYQNSTFVTAYTAVGGEMVTHKQMALLSYAYCVISIIGLLACVPIWKIMGLVP
jgi:DASS family divalent anion:Na+ symporter